MMQKKTCVCQGDGGGPLVCESEGQWYQVLLQHSTLALEFERKRAKLDVLSLADGHRQLWDWLWKSWSSRSLHDGQNSEEDTSPTFWF